MSQFNLTEIHKVKALLMEFFWQTFFGENLCCEDYVFFCAHKKTASIHLMACKLQMLSFLLILLHGCCLAFLSPLMSHINVNMF